MTTRSSVAAVAVAAAFLVSACGSDGDDAATRPDQASALPANFDLAADSPQAFLLGLIGPDQESVAYGTVDLVFAYTGTASRPLAEPRPGPKRTASFLAVTGRQDPSTPGPQMVAPSKARGVYATEPMRFPDAGFWDVTARFEVDGRTIDATATFEVLGQHQVPAVGEDAPRTVNPIAGDPAVPPEAIDSRALGTEPIPDPELHATTIAAALDAHRPLTVVVSTPTYCTSRFCGPVTDTVSALATRYGDRMDFVHLEVWENFEEQKISPAAAEWVVPASGGGNEPWVFVVDGDGTITRRFDNVATRALIEDAIKETLG